MGGFRRVPRELWRYLAVFALALAVRAVYLGELVGSPVVATLLGDARRYHEWAHEIVAGSWLGDQVFYQAPLYPYFLAFVYWLLSPAAWAARWVQVVGGAFSCVLLAAAGRRFFSPPVGWLAAVLLALYAPALFFDGLLQKAALGLLFLTALLALLGKWLDSAASRWAFGIGLSLGGLALLRENALVLIPPVVVWVAVVRRGASPSPPASDRWRALVFLMLGLAAFLLPVGARNWWIGREFLITTSQSGSNFYIGNNPRANGGYVPLRPRGGDARVERADATDLAEEALGRELTPGEVSRFWWSRALDFIRAEPGAWFRLMIHKTRLVFHARENVDTDSIEAYADHSWLLSVLGRLFHFGVVFPLAVLGLWSTRKDWRRLWILHAMLIALAGSVAAFYVVARYRYPLAPILILFAAAGLVDLQRRIKRSKRRALRPLARSLALVAAVALVVNWPLAAGPDPRATTYLNLGLNLTDEKRFEEAVSQLERAVELAPEVPATRRALARAYNRRGGSLIAEGRLEEARSSLRHVIELAASYPRQVEPLDAALAHNQIANILAHQGKSDAALEEYQVALTLAPGLADARLKLGSLLVAQGRASESLVHLEEAARRLPEFAPAHLSLGDARERLGDVEAAAAAYRRVLEIEPENQTARSALLRIEPLRSESRE